MTNAYSSPRARTSTSSPARSATTRRSPAATNSWSAVARTSSAPVASVSCSVPSAANTPATSSRIVVRPNGATGASATSGTTPVAISTARLPVTINTSPLTEAGRSRDTSAMDWIASMYAAARVSSPIASRPDIGRSAMSPSRSATAARSRSSSICSTASQRRRRSAGSTGISAASKTTRSSPGVPGTAQAILPASCAMSSTRTGTPNASAHRPAALPSVLGSPRSVVAIVPASSNPAELWSNVSTASSSAPNGSVMLLSRRVGSESDISA